MGKLKRGRNAWGREEVGGREGGGGVRDRLNQTEGEGSGSEGGVG